jgi:hypothetical protein
LIDATRYAQMRFCRGRGYRNARFCQDYGWRPTDGENRAKTA